MATLKVSVNGTKALKSALRRYGKGAQDALARELYVEMNELIADAITITPIDTGALRASARVERPRKGVFGGVSVTGGFGGPAAPYALYVHENVGANFQAPGTGAKFLEIPYKRRIRGMAGRIAARLRASRPLRRARGN